jgi:dethiobiotin synthetase
VSQVIFITGTDTGVGKTVLTAMLLWHLRRNGGRALAMKPFCSGGRGDARLLWSLQKDAISLDEINPFYFPKPLAPWVAQRGKTASKPEITMAKAVKPIEAVKKRCETLLIEGSGGVFVPVSPRLMVADLIARTAARVIVAAPNALGTINHTLLTVEALRSRGVQSIKIVLMARQSPDPSAATNLATLAHFLRDIPIIELPYLGPRASVTTEVKKNAETLRDSLESLGV